MKLVRRLATLAALLTLLAPSTASASNDYQNPSSGYCLRGFNPIAYSGYIWIPCVSRGWINHPWL